MDWIDVASRILVDLVYLAALWVISRVAAPLYRWYLTHTTATQQTLIERLATSFVLLVEKDLPNMPGSKQFSQAAFLLLDAVRQRGITVSPHDVQAAIQRAYADAKQSGVLAASKPKPAEQG